MTWQIHDQIQFGGRKAYDMTQYDMKLQNESKNKDATKIKKATN